jgi:hypothetical protein
MKKRCIFTYANHQINENILEYQKLVISKYNRIENCDYQFLRYNAVDQQVFPDQVIDHGLNEIFYLANYDTVLILDIDCIPLSTESLQYTFDRAESGIFIGNAQRSNHIENDKHVYPAPSCVCFTREMFERLGKPSFTPTKRGDIGEEMCYIAERENIDIEMFLPMNYETLPYQCTEPWDLSDTMPKYGIGTTFGNSAGKEMFYHLFQSRVEIFNELFFEKCKSILKMK